MPTKLPNPRAALAALTILLSSVVYPVTVTVQDTGVAPSMNVGVSVAGSPQIDALKAGVVNLIVDGVAADAFCIDPFHRSNPGPLFYELVSVSDAPRSSSPYVGPMGPVAAEKVSKLWAKAYTPSMNATDAAALQLAIWEVVGGDFFAWTGSGGVYDLAQELLDGLPTYGASANLAALKSLTTQGQDYVFQVPDSGATAALLGGAFATLLIARRKVHA